MPIYRFISEFNQADPRSARYLKDALALGFSDLQKIQCQDLYFIDGQLSQDDLSQLAVRLFTDAVTQTTNWHEIGAGASLPPTRDDVIEVALRPGVTDPVAGQIVRAAHELGFSGVQRAATGSRYLVAGLSQSRLIQLAKRLLVNPVIQHWSTTEISPAFPEETASSGAVEIIIVRALGDDQLLKVSQERRAALDLAEMRAVQAYFQQEGRDPTDVEFETIAQTWSEHCGHKTFKARVCFPDGREIDSLLNTYLKSATDAIAAPWVLSAFVDNAGILEFDEDFEVSFKVETHNHPSAIEPFGGANTGVGGVIRDVLGVSAKPIANTDILCFGPQNLDPDLLPEGVLHPRRIQRGVVAGVQDYGNKIGIPTVNGAILYDEGYTSNPLVFCGCVGLAPRGKHHKDPRRGDRMIVLGGQTGRDGLRGATFSSMTMDAQTGEVSGASVQIGDPIVEKGLIEVITRARDLALYHDITDCGAGGLSSAAGEMAAGIGAEIELQDVKLKYAGLAPWEIWLSEAQERMVLAVPPENIPALRQLCDTFDTELTDIGVFTGSGRLVVCHAGVNVLDMDNQFLHHGIPQRRLDAALSVSTADPVGDDSVDPTGTGHPKELLLALLSDPNIASKAGTIRSYDHEVQGGTVIKPLTGVEADGPSDAAVLKPIGTRGSMGIVLSNGINPEYGKRNPYQMAWAVIDEAIRNAVAVGADPDRIAILDNFCWGDPLRPETMTSLAEAARGCHDGAIHYAAPFISGKDSLNNEYLGQDGQRHAIPPTLLISAIGFIPDVANAVSMDLKQPGDYLYLAGDFQPVWGGSRLSTILGTSLPGGIPAPDRNAPSLYRAVHQAMTKQLVLAAHDLSEGGLAVAAAEMCIGGRLGLDLDEKYSKSLRSLFGETNGCLLLEVKPQHAADFERLFDGLPLAQVGTVTSQPVFSFTGLTIPLHELVSAFNPSEPASFTPKNK